MNKLFETNKKAATIPDAPDTLIQFHDRPYIAKYMVYHIKK